MRQTKKKSALMKGMKRTMAVSLGVMMTGGYFANLAPLAVKADTVAAIFEDFESDTRVGGQMGSVTLERSANAFAGESALFVTNREQDWNSYSYDISAFNGKSFHFNAQMRVDADNLNAIVCVKTTVAGEDKYTWINNSPLANGQYTEINCNFTIPADSSSTVLYFGTFSTTENAQTLDSYYLDNVSIKETILMQENFDAAVDTSSLKGFSFGSPTLALVENGSAENKALEVSDRTANYFGYAYDIKAFAGNKIKVKANISAVGAVEDASNEFAVTLKTGENETDYNRVGSVTTLGSGYTVMESAEYDVPKDADVYLLYFEGPENVTYAIDDVEIYVVGDVQTVTPDNPGTNPETYADYTTYPALKELYKDYFKLGFACESISNFNNNLSEIGNPDKENLLKLQASTITFGNELKPDYNMGCKDASATETFLPFVINPSAKEMLDWAKLNGMPVRGHTIFWHSQCPDEVFCKDYTPIKSDGTNLDSDCLASRDVMLQRMESYTDNLMKYMYENGYADVIYAWDVVNEAVEPGHNEYGLRESYWYKTVGPDFLYYAFKYAREAENKYAAEYASLYGVDPSAPAQLKTITPSLFYNDYNEFQADKCDAIIRMVSTDFAGHNILADGYIDGIGMQGHVSDNTSVESYINALRKYSAVVDEVQITELDVSTTTSGANAQYYQAKFYKDLFSALINEVKNGSNLNSVTIWGLTDDNSWKKQDLPLIFNGDLSKKMAFDGIVAAAEGTELPGPAYEAPDFKDIDATFDAEDATAESEGFTPRGDGTLSIQSDVVFNGKGALLDTGRTANWNGASFDVSRFIGQTIEISAWVKSAASEVKLSADIDGVWPNIAAVDTSDGTWKQIKGVYKVPSDMTSLKLYFENDTTDDLYIDYVKVKLQGMNEDFEGSVNIAGGRGVGHVPSVAAVTDTESHTEGGHSFLVQRAEQDANMKFDVSKYIGHTVTVKAYVKTADAKIRMGMDGETPVQLVEVDSDGEWTEVSATCNISNQLTSAFMYIETDGNADFYVDDINVAMADFKEDCEGDTIAFTTRWGGAGTLEVVEEDGNHVAVLKNRTENYFGTAFDVSAYLGTEVEITMDVKTEDDKITVTGDINNLWPNYLTTTSNKGQYKTIHAVVKLPDDLSSMKVYVETDGKSDLYVDNLTIKRVPLGDQVKFTFDANGQGTAPATQLVNVGSYASQVTLDANAGYDFGGWYKEADCKTPWDFAADAVTQETTVYAKWTNNDNPDSTPTPTPTTDPTPTPSPIPSNPTPSSTTVTPPQKTGNNSAAGLYDTATDYRVVYGADIKEASVINTSLRKALDAGKKVSHEFNDKDGNLAYSFTFKPDNYNSKLELRNMKLGLTMGSAEELNYKDGMLVSMAQTGKLAMETSLKVNVKDYFKAGDVVYVYKYNNDTKKLECLPNNKITVASDSYATFTIKSGADYVLLKAPADKKDKRGFLGQVKYTKNLALGARETMDKIFELPDIFDVVSSLDQFDASKNLASIGVTVTYKSSNNKVVSIDEEGNIWAIRKGKCRVAVTVKTSTGKTKKFVTTVTVK